MDTTTLETKVRELRGGGELVRRVEALAPPWLSFLRAHDWGVIWKRPPVAERLDDPETYVHHSAGSQWHPTDAAQAMRNMQRWSHDGKNYSTIAYDIVVHESTAAAVTICGAREQWLSAATARRNEQGEAICALGYYHPGHATLSAQPSNRMVTALAYAAAWSIAHGWSSPTTDIRGHRDNPNQTNGTPCPGDYLYPHVPAIAGHAREIIIAAINLTDTDQEPTLKTVRIAGTADQFALLPLSPDTKRRLNLPEGDATIVVESDLTPAELSAVLGYPVTPI